MCILLVFYSLICENAQCRTHKAELRCLQTVYANCLRTLYVDTIGAVVTSHQKNVQLFETQCRLCVKCFKTQNLSVFPPHREFHLIHSKQ